MNRTFQKSPVAIYTLLLALLALVLTVTLPLESVHAERGKHAQSKKAGKKAKRGKAGKRSSRRTSRIKHKIIPGETLQSIAKRYGVTPKMIKRWNTIKGNNIVAGKTLIIHARRQARPRSEIEHTVKKGETFAVIAKKHGVETDDLIAWNRRIDPRRLRPGMSVIVYKLGALEKSTSRGSANSGRLAGAQQLPDGRGYTVRRASRAWGTATLNNLLMKAIGKTKRKFPKAHNLVIGDLSHKKGGPMRPHKSHQSGRDADVSYYLKGGLGGVRFVNASPKTLDVPKTFHLFEQFIASGRVRYIFVDYNLQKVLYEYAKDKKKKSKKWLDMAFQYPRPKHNGVGIIRWSRGHDDHFHIRVTCRKGDKACR